jgi:hypothetical protein
MAGVGCFVVDYNVAEGRLFENATTRQQVIDIYKTITATSYMGAAIKDNSLHSIMMRSYSQEDKAKDCTKNNYVLKQLTLMGHPVSISVYCDVDIVYIILTDANPHTGWKQRERGSRPRLNSLPG